MPDSRAIDALVQVRLRRDEARSDREWTVWEHKTLNLHRAVVYWHPGRSHGDYTAAAAEVRRKIAGDFKRSWWRGFAFGAILELPGLPPDLATCEADIDVRDNRKGTWQWSVVVSPTSRVAFGIHTWTHGYLTGVYESLLDHYRTLQFEVGSFKKEKDRLLAFLERISGKKFGEFEPR
jgi:hypothetical protein